MELDKSNSGSDITGYILSWQPRGLGHTAAILSGVRVRWVLCVAENPDQPYISDGVHQATAAAHHLMVGWLAGFGTIGVGVVGGGGLHGRAICHIKDPRRPETRPDSDM